MERLLRYAFIILGAVVGFRAADFVTAQGFSHEGLEYPYLVALAVTFGALLGFAVSPVLINGVTAWAARLIQGLQKTPMSDLLAGAFGLVVGLMIAILVTVPLPRDLAFFGDYLPIAITLILGYGGMVFGFRKREELLSMLFRRSAGFETVHEAERCAPKILDTSVIIDGRIADIVNSGFVEGALVVPGFILEELQHIADSSDVLKRNRGRRGLDVLNRMQKEAHIEIQVLDTDFEDIAEVDSKLVKLAKTLAGKVVTNDYNLNKICELQGVKVLNINELANSVKPVVLPGEELKVHVIKDGKEHGQGVAYLDDGTMIVVDGGRRFIGETVGVSVTSVLQTAAGRMIFAKPKAMERAL